MTVGETFISSRPDNLSLSLIPFYEMVTVDSYTIKNNKSKK